MVYYVVNKITNRCYELVNFGNQEYCFVKDLGKEQQRKMKEGRDYLEGLKRVCQKKN